MIEIEQVSNGYVIKDNRDGGVYVEKTKKDVIARISELMEDG